MTLRKRNHFIEIAEKRIDESTLKEVRDMIGFYTPDGEKWNVQTCEKGSGIVVDNQFQAEVIASLEQIKHMLYLVLKGDE